MDAQDALPPLIERVDQQLTPFSQASLHPRLDLNPSSLIGPTLLHPTLRNNGRRRLGYF